MATLVSSDFSTLGEGAAPSDWSAALSQLVKVGSVGGVSKNGSGSSGSADLYKSFDSALILSSSIFRIRATIRHFDNIVYVNYNDRETLTILGVTNSGSRFCGFKVWNSTGDYWIGGCTNFNENGSEGNSKKITSLFDADNQIEVEFVMNTSLDTAYCIVNDTFIDDMLVTAFSSIPTGSVNISERRLGSAGLWGLRTFGICDVAYHDVTNNSISASETLTLLDGAASMASIAHESSPRATRLNTGKFRTGQFIGKRLE